MNDFPAIIDQKCISINREKGVPIISRARIYQCANCFLSISGSKIENTYNEKDIEEVILFHIELIKTANKNNDCWLFYKLKNKLFT